MLLERYGLEVVMAFIKDMVRMWLHAWKRFISIALISLLGVAVLTGIYAGCRDAFLATDRFFDTQGLHDIQVLSTAGLTDDDIAELRKISGVAKVQGERSQTVTVDLNGKKTVTMQEIGTNGIDQPYLQSGRMPEKSGEIAVTRKFIKDSGYKKGDHITVTPQDSASSSVSDSAESDTQDGKRAARVTDSGESDNCGAYGVVYLSVSPEAVICTSDSDGLLSDSAESDIRGASAGRSRCVRCAF